MNGFTWNSLVNKDYITNKKIDNYLKGNKFKIAKLEELDVGKFVFKNIKDKILYIEKEWWVDVDHMTKTAVFLGINFSHVYYAHSFANFTYDGYFIRNEVSKEKIINIDNKDIFNSVESFDEYMNSFDFLK